MSNLSRTQLNELADIYSSMSSTESPEQLDEISRDLATRAAIERLKRTKLQDVQRFGRGAADIYQRGMRWVKTKAGADPNRSAVMQALEAGGRNLSKLTGSVVRNVGDASKNLATGYGRGVVRPLQSKPARQIMGTLGNLTTLGALGAGLVTGGIYGYRKLTGADRQQLGDSYNMMEELNSIPEELLEETLSSGLYFMAVEHLIAEGYATDINSANVMIENMSEEWAQSILEDCITYIEG